jgi:hypothetical protein
MLSTFVTTRSKVNGLIAAVLVGLAFGAGSLAPVAAQASATAHVVRAVPATANCSPRCRACVGVCG